MACAVIGSILLGSGNIRRGGGNVKVRLLDGGNCRIEQGGRYREGIAVRGWTKAL